LSALDPVTAAPGHEPGRDHVALKARLAQVPRQAETGGARLVADPRDSASAQLTLDQLAVEGQGALVQELVLEHHGQADRSGMDIQARNRKVSGCII
jgi:hypothetical protein